MTPDLDIGELVERLEADSRCSYLRERPWRGKGGLQRDLVKAATALRALIAEREALRAELADCREGRRMISSGAFDSGIITESAVARAEAAEAEAAVLREALLTWDCGSCNDGNYLNRTKDDSEIVDCKVCGGTGLHPNAAQALQTKRRP